MYKVGLKDNLASVKDMELVRDVLTPRDVNQELLLVSMGFRITSRVEIENSDRTYMVKIKQ
jgi:hypothetical protein